MGVYIVTMQYKDGSTRKTRINASSAASARSGVRKLASRQLRSHDFGGDKSAGMPTITNVEKE